MFRSSGSLMENLQITNTVAEATMAPRETLECRSFWKAGENFSIPTVVTPAAPVICYGTEGRNGSQIPPIHEVFTYIIFSGNHIKENWAMGITKRAGQSQRSLEESHSQILYISKPTLVLLGS